MDFKSLLSQLDQLNEATKETGKGRIHTAEPGGYGRKDDEDSEGKKVKADAPKKGRGRPKKNADSETGEEKKFDTKSLGAALGAGQKPKKEVGTVSKKHRLKEYFDSMDAALNEMMAQQAIPVVGKQGDTQQTGAGFLHIDDNSPAGQAMKDAISKLAQQKKAQIVVPTQQQKPGQPVQQGQQTMSEDDMDEATGDYSAKKARAGKDIGKPGKQFAKIAADAAKRYGSKERGEKVAGAVLAKLRATHESIEEGTIPTDDSTAGAGLGAGRSATTLEGKAKPDFLDLDKDGNKKESMKKAAQDKKKVDEGMNHKLQSARLAGKAHALAKEGYNCRYDDMEEARHYHEGYKEGLDECYGQMPIQGYVGETTPPATVSGMADQAEHDGVEEGNAFTAALAKTPKGGKFSVGGKTFTDKTNYDAKVTESPFAFESWDKELNALLEGKEEVSEGMTVSISKGQQGMPDSVSVTAQDGEADQLLALIKQAGLGLFGGEEAPAAAPMTVDKGEPAEIGTGGAEIDVVDDHDGMMNLIKKVVGAEPKGPEAGFAGHDHDFEDEDHEEVCDACGKSDCGCDDEEAVEETETMDQRTYQVAEDETEEQETSADENAEAAEDEASANYAKGEHEAEAASYEAAAEEEKDLEESYANSADDTFETDIKFMTDVISSGLNKKKSTGQTTVPVIAGQNDRMGYNGATNESVNDWKKLAGIK